MDKTFDFEEQIIYYLFKNDLYFNKVFQNIKKEIFINENAQLLIKYLQQYVKEYNSKPKTGDLLIYINDNNKQNYESLKNYIEFIKNNGKKFPIENFKQLMDKTEKFIKFKYLELAILDSVDIIKNKDEKQINIIEDKIKNALTISFDNNLGLDYKSEIEKRIQFYHEEAEKYQIDLETLNQALSSGFTKNAMYLIIGKTGGGKTLFLINIAELLLKAGFNILYITAEMNVMKISERIDAKILKMPIKDLYQLEEKLFLQKFNLIVTQSYPGNLIIKEYPTSSATMMDIKSLLKELELKKNFKPDFIILDYLNIFASYRLSSSKSSDTYTYFKNVAEEMRALASENIGIITATQTNREGAKKSAKDVDDTSISESYGVEHTVDWSANIITNDELKERNEILLKITKTRFGDNLGKVYKLGIDYNNMTLFDLEEDEREMIPMSIQEQDQQNETEDAKFKNTFL